MLQLVLKPHPILFAMCWLFCLQTSSSSSTDTEQFLTSSTKSSSSAAVAAVFSSPVSLWAIMCVYCGVSVLMILCVYLCRVLQGLNRNVNYRPKMLYLLWNRKKRLKSHFSCTSHFSVKERSYDNLLTECSYYVIIYYIIYLSRNLYCC